MFETAVAVVSIEPTSMPATHVPTSALVERSGLAHFQQPPQHVVAEICRCEPRLALGRDPRLSSLPAAIPVFRIFSSSPRLRNVSWNTARATRSRSASLGPLDAEHSGGDHVPRHLPRIAVDDIDLSVARGRRGQKLRRLVAEDLADRREVRARSSRRRPRPAARTALSNGPCRG